MLREKPAGKGPIKPARKRKRTSGSTTVDPTKGLRGSRSSERGPRSVSWNGPELQQLLASLTGAIVRKSSAEHELADARAGIRNLIYDIRRAAGLSYRTLGTEARTDWSFIRKLETSQWWSEPAVERILSAFVRLAEESSKSPQAG